MNLQNEYDEPGGVPSERTARQPRLRRKSGWSYAKKWLAPTVILTLIVAVATSVVFVSRKANADDVDTKIQRIVDEHRQDYRSWDKRIDRIENRQVETKAAIEELTRAVRRLDEQ